MTLKMNTMENAGTINLGKTTTAAATTETTKSWLRRGLEMMGEAMLINTTAGIPGY